MSIVFALILILILVGCWLSTLVGLPGNWAIVVAATIYAFLKPTQSTAALGWKTIVVLLTLAILGEVVELLTSAVGTARRGGSRRGALTALAGSLIGSIAGVFIGLPIPVVGPMVAAVLFAGIGAMVGAILGEISTGRHFDVSWHVGKAAFWGRLAGTLGKFLCGAAMIVAVILGMIL